MAFSILQFVGSVAVLFWAVGHLKVTLIEVLSDRLSELFTKIAENLNMSAAAGALVALLLQSSSATAVLVAGLAERGTLTATAALVAILGGDWGSSVVVQLLSLHPAMIWPVFILAGSLLSARSNPKLALLGQIVVAVGLVMVSLGMVVAATVPLERSPAFQAVVVGASVGFLAPALFGAILAWVSHSSVAAILVIAGMTRSAEFSPQIALVMVLGANIGSAVIPLVVARTSSLAARVALWANLTLRIGAAASMLLIVRIFDPPLGWLGAGQAVPINAHLLLNSMLVLASVPMIHLARSATHGPRQLRIARLLAIRLRTRPFPRKKDVAC